MHSLEIRWRLVIVLLIGGFGFCNPDVVVAQHSSATVDTTVVRHDSDAHPYSKFEEPSIDEVLFRSINAWGRTTASLDNLMIDLSGSLVYTSIAAPVGFYVYGRARPDVYATYSGLGIMITELGAGGITTGLRYLVQRVRPFNALKDVREPSGDEAGYSFPSGHATIAWALATGISLHYPKWYVIAPSVLYATAVSISRPYLGVHYPLDLVAGAIVGAGTAWLVRSIEQRILSKAPVLFPKGADLSTDYIAAQSSKFPLISFSVPIK